MRILIDLDDTVAHFRKKFNALRAELFPHLSGIPDLNVATGFNLWEGRTAEEVKATAAIMDYPSFYRDLEPYEGAVEAVQEMLGMGHEVFFLSSPWITNPTGASDKYAWVEQHFGFIMAKKLILARDKSVVSGDVLFDDRHPIPNKERASWTQVFVDASYNRDAEGYRIHSWSTDEWKYILNDIEEGRTNPVDILPDFKLIGS